MGLDYIRELLSGRRSSLLVLVVSGLEVPEVVSTVELTGPNLRHGQRVLLTGASPSQSNTSVLRPGSLDLCGTWGSAGKNPRHACRLGGTKVDSAGSFVVSSLLSTTVPKHSTSNTFNCSWKTRFTHACPSIQSKCIPSVVNLA